MENTLTTVDNAVNTPATIDATVMTWKTKNGTERAAHTAVGQLRAPKAVRVSAAQDKTLTQLNNGMYRPFIKDTVAALTAAQLAGLRSHVMAGLSTVVDGVPMAPVGDAFATPNKRLVSLVASWLLAPVALKGKGKGAARIETLEPVTLKGVAGDLAIVAGLFLSQQSETEAATEAATEASEA